MTRRPGDSHLGLKIAISATAVAVLIVRVVFPDVQLDAVSLGLIAIAVIPWLSPLIKSAALPGGFSIEFQDVRDAAKLVAGEAVSSGAGPSDESLSFIAVAEQDPSLALVGLRIEIEKRVKALAEQHGLVKSHPLTQLTRQLGDKGVLDRSAAEGLVDLITYGNQAAHGVTVSPEAARSAVEYGPRVLGALDSKLADR